MSRTGRHEPPAARCSATSLLAAATLPALAALVLRGWRAAAVTVFVQLLLLVPFIARRGGPRPVRVLPGVVAAGSVTWSTWLFGDGGAGVALASGIRVLALVTPGVLLLGCLDPARLGDELGQWFGVPARPVLAAVAALQQLGGFTENWRTLTRARRSRGLGPGRSPWSRIHSAAAMTLPLLIGALGRAEALSDAMAVRGLGAGPHRTWAVPPRWGRVDSALLAAALVLTAVPLLADRTCLS